MTLYAAAGALALVAGGAAAQQAAMSEQVSMDQVPAAAKAAATYAAGGTELTDVALDLDGGQATDEFTGKDADGRQVEIDVLPDGKVTEIEHEVSQDQVPQQVIDATKQYLPDFQPQFIERSMRAGEPVSIYYEMEGTAPDGKEIDVEVYESGGLVTIQQDPTF